MQQNIINSNNSQPILASKGSRIFANLIDIFISLLIGMPLVYLIFTLFKDPIIGGDVGYDDIYQLLFLFFIAPVISITLICPIYEFLVAIGKNTNTLGKLAVGIKIVNNKPGRIRKRTLLIRSLFKLFYYALCMVAAYANFVIGGIIGIMISLFIILLFIFVFMGNRLNQGLHNKLMGISIVYINKK